MKIFLCSTFEDLRDERKAVLALLHSLDIEHDAMELFGARPGTPAEECRRRVMECDLVIVLIGQLYGSIPTNGQLSFTELEYRTAREAHKDCLIYERSSDVPVLPRFVEQDPHKLPLRDNFHAHLRRDHIVHLFTCPTELAERVALDVLGHRSATRTRQSAQERHPVSVDVHRRFMRVDESGIVELRVELEGVAYSDRTVPLVLARLNPPSGSVEADAWYYTQERGGQQRAGKVSEHRASDGTRTYRALDAPPEGRLQWRCRIHGIVPLYARDLPFVAAERTDSGVVVLPQLLELPSRRLQLSYQLPACHISGLIRKSSVSSTEWDRIPDWKLVQQPGQPTEETSGSTSFDVDPMETAGTGEYAISVAFTSPPSDSERALHAAEVIVRELRRTPFNEIKRLNVFSENMAKEIEDQLGKRRWTSRAGSNWGKCTLTALIWSTSRRALEPCFGNCSIDQMTVAVPFGVGMAGHSLRFGSPASFVAGKSLIAQHEDTDDWKLVVPIGFGSGSLAIGVAHFSGRNHDDSAVGGGLRQLIRELTTHTSPKEAHTQLGSLSWRINCAFWATLAYSDGPSDVVHVAAHVLRSYQHLTPG